MLGHISFGVNDLAKSATFYDAALAELGYARVWSNSTGIGYGRAGQNDKLTLFARPGRAAAPGEGFHLALIAPSRAAVDRFHAVALNSGGRDLGGPGARPNYGPAYYAAFVADPDGYKLEAVHQ